MKPRLDWSDPEVRRDTAIVICLFAFGLVLTATVGLAAIWLLDMVGLWPEAEPIPAARGVDVTFFDQGRSPA